MSNQAESEGGAGNISPEKKLMPDFSKATDILTASIAEAVQKATTQGVKVDSKVQARLVGASEVSTRRSTRSTKLIQSAPEIGDPNAAGTKTNDGRKEKKGKQKKTDLATKKKTDPHQVQLDDQNEYNDWAALIRDEKLFSNADMLEFKTEEVYLTLPKVVLSDLVGLSDITVITKSGSATFSPGEVFVLACMSQYYDKLPAIGYSFKTLLVLHTIVRAAEMGMVIDSEDEMAGIFQFIKRLGLEGICVKLSEIMLPPSSSAVADLAELVDEAVLVDLYNSADEIPAFIVKTINFIGHLAELHPKSLDMFPHFLDYTQSIIAFVDSVNNGTKTTKSIQMSFKGVWDSVVFADFVNAPLEETSGEESESEIDANVDRSKGDQGVVITSEKMSDESKETRVADFEERGDLRKKQKIDKQFEHKETTQFVNRMVMPEARDITAKVVKDQTTALKSTIVHPVSVGGSSAPTGPFEISSFRESLNEFKTSILAKLAQMEAKIDSTSKTLGSFSDNLSDVICRLVVADLSYRQTLNAGFEANQSEKDPSIAVGRALSIAEQINRSSAPSTVRGIVNMSAEKRDLIKKLEGPVVKRDNEWIINKTVQMLKGTARAGLISNISPTTVTNLGFRRRLAQALRETNESEDTTQ